MSLLARIFLGLIRVYQCTLSTVMGKQCRYYPTCSHYASGAIRRFGALKGGWMGMKRILRCHPWQKGGYDPVPEKLCHSGETCDKSAYDSEVKAIQK